MDAGGTEAAVTAVVIGVTSAPVEPPVGVTIDRPFILLIRDIAAGTILPVERVVNPDAKSLPSGLRDCLW